MSVPLWPHQEAAIKFALDAIGRCCKRALWVMPTGTGKTRAFCELAHQIGGRVLIVVHRDELIRQTQDWLADVWPEASVEVIKGRSTRWKEATACIASVQTLVRRVKQIDPAAFDLVVIDEAHHVPAASWDRVTRHFQPALLLGCTATPKRLDGKDLRDWFGEPVYVYRLRKAIKDGVLVPLRQLAVYTQVSLDGLNRRTRGEFRDADLSHVVNTGSRNAAVVEAYRSHAGGRRTLVFAADLDHVEQLRAAFEAAGVRVAAVTGKTPRELRRRVLEEFQRGVYEVLVSCGVLVEGYDDRGVGCVIMARPTKSPARYQQCVGRGLRADPSSGKTDCLVIEVRDQSHLHSLATASLMFGDVEVADCKGQDVRQAIRLERDRIHLCPLALTPGQKARWANGSENPWPRIPDLQGYQANPDAQWSGEPATSKQLKFLSRFGLVALRPLTRGEASHLIEMAQDLAREYPTPATPAQEKLLRARGQWSEGLSKLDASRLIGTGRFVSV